MASPSSPGPAKKELPPEHLEAARVVLARLPPEFRAKPTALDARVQCPKFTQAMAKWNWGGPCVLLSGPTGTGKSTALAAAAIRLVCRPDPRWRRVLGVRWFVTGDLAAKRMQWPLGRGECPQITQARECRLLILDNLGAGDRDPKFIDELFCILDHRKTHNLPVWTSTELTIEQLTSNPYNDQLLRRLHERGGKQGIIVSSY